ncbi:MAG: elongation factor G [Calditrichaeota bacterium]|nr:elongation factor G [Calditrichota bacterium]MCB9473987.1 elongation factor G [Candidatus Delongbacteria bacterium]
MKVYDADRIRNVAVVGHEATGKTIFTEAVLKLTGKIGRMGSIEERSTVSDFSPVEHDIQKSVGCSLIQTEFKNCKLNIIDTPGFADFVGDTRAGLHVADIAMVMLNPINGPEVMTETIMDIVNERGIPCMFVFNMLDKEHVKFDEELAVLREQYRRSVPLQYPLDQGVPGFHRIVDVLDRKILVFDAEGNYTEVELGDEAARVDELFEGMQEAVAESDDALMEKFLEEGTLSEEDFHRGLDAGIRSGSIRPVFCCSGRTLAGVSRILEILVEDFPSPLAMPEARGEADGKEVTVVCADDAPVRAFVFKTVSEQHVGELSYFRVYSGLLNQGMELINASQGDHEKLGNLFSVHGKNRSDLPQIHAGDMGCTVKLKHTHTNDSLCTKGGVVKMQPIIFPDPVIRTAIVPTNSDDDDKMMSGLLAIHHEDPSFTVVQDGELHQIILAGTGEVQFKVLLQKLEVRYGVTVTQHRPRVPYCETITGNADVKYRHKKQTGGAGQFAEVWIRIKPTARGEGFKFSSSVVGGAVSGPFIQATEKGILSLLKEGIVAGCRVEDVAVEIYDGKMHAVDSKDIAFQIAGKEAFKQGFRESNPILLEPIWEVEVKVPEEFMGDVMGDLNTRRGKILGMEGSGKYQMIRAEVPLAELYQYSTVLRSMTQGRASHRRKFSHYEKCPTLVQQKVIEEYEASREH